MNQGDISNFHDVLYLDLQVFICCHLTNHQVPVLPLVNTPGRWPRGGPANERLDESVSARYTKVFVKKCTLQFGQTWKIIADHIYLLYVTNILGDWFSINMPNSRFIKPHCGDKAILWSSYLLNRNFYTVKATSLYRIWPWLPGKFKCWYVYIYCNIIDSPMIGNEHTRW